MTKFMCRYRQELKDFYQVLNKKESALVNFKELLNAVELSENKLYIFIDEYDTGMNEALKNESVLQPLSKIEAVKSSFKQFYSRLKSACDNGIFYVFQTGVTPIVMAEFISGFNISTDLTLREKFWDLYGFKKSEVEFLLDNISGNRFSYGIKNGIMKWLENKYGRYYFNPYQKECVFNTGSILDANRKNKTEYCKDISINVKNLLRFPPDPHTLPSQTTLDLIVNNPLELATDRTPLLSFLFYIGALIYQPDISHFSFWIPNNVSKRDFISESLKIHEWKQDDLTPVRQCLQILEGNDDIDPLCQFVEEQLLKPLKDNSIVYSNEEALKQTFLDTLTLTLHADIEPEFKVYFNSKYLCGKAIDLVKTSTGKRIAIEFDNIKTECIKLKGVHDSWQEATRISLSLMKKSRN
ncbi:hypothetical protein Glove_718g2 [Diversispora epigaea]|uniref:AAA-ATPase-like domain-containing protein n=1 Tax=Diversispora epigaea TaxID=1348612 RepID=A0A397G6P3_9GLOM|nr:hypothetical protein Glove_718g2 [Diversispora epigaea]